MAGCNNGAIAKIYGHQLPSSFSELSKYKQEIEQSLVTVTINYRSTKNGSLKTGKCQIHKNLANNFKEACEEIAQNPSVVFNWGGSYCFRKMNNGSSNPPASVHSVGCAFDVNVPQNPYAKDSFPDDELRMRTINHPIVQAFVKRGWVWGGTWRTPDYMHFEFTNVNANIDSSNNTYQESYTPEERAYSFSGSGNSASFGSGIKNSSNEPNKVFQLASNGERTNVAKINDGRKGQFEALRNSLKSDMLNMGRDVIESTELYNSSILKTSQSAKIKRT